MTTKEYVSRVKAYGKVVNEKWEAVRYIAWTVVRMSGKVMNTPPRRPQDLFKLPSDENIVHEPIEITENEIEALKNIGLLK